MTQPFKDLNPNIIDNELIRSPQREAYLALAQSAAEDSDEEKEVGIVLPVGCGKSGTIAIAPFAYGSKRTLVIAPGIAISAQLEQEFNPSNPKMFYRKCKILLSPPFPEPVAIRGTSSNRTDLEDADVVITNIQQLQGNDNRWLKKLPKDFFDLIIFDEGHHSVAATWELLKQNFPEAKIINFSATPLRADGQIMAGKILYSFPISKAIKAGYVKQLKAVQLNPATLRYVRRGDDKEIEVSLAEVIKLGEQEADFRRSIVTSKESLATIVDASIHELQKLRESTGEKRLKIIASVLNFEHCRQVVEAYRSRGVRADYVHSKQDGAANNKVMALLDAHQLDVIVQVRKLGEGFDHPYLSVAAVFSVFGSLSPFVQFVGRIMRVIVQNQPESPVNQGVVVFHAGANIAQKWHDFKLYSAADQEYFDQLLPLEFSEPTKTGNTREYFPDLDIGDAVTVKGQSLIELEELNLLPPDQAAAIELLKSSGVIPEDFNPLKETLQPIPMTKVAQRQAMRASLNMRVNTESARILKQNGINPGGSDLDPLRRGRINWTLLKSNIDKHVNLHVGKAAKSRSELSRDELTKIEENFAEICEAAWSELKNGS
jgi:superfamily II DNA or RNA helicase